MIKQLRTLQSIWTGGIGRVLAAERAACQVIIVADKPLRLRRITLFYSEQQYLQNITITVANMKDKSHESVSQRLVVIIVADKPLRLRPITLFYSEQQYLQNITITVANRKDKSHEKPKVEPVGPRGPLVFKRGVYLSANTEYNIAVHCMVYRGNVKATELTNTYLGMLISVRSVFDAIESIYLSRVHSA